MSDSDWGMVVAGILIVVCIIAFPFGLAWLVGWLWNDLVPELAGGPEVSYLQAFKIGLVYLLVLCLFGAANGTVKK